MRVLMLMRSTTHWLAAMALATASLPACQLQPDRDLGDSLDDRALELSEPPAPTEPFGISPLEFVGRWVGAADEPLAFGGTREAYVFPSGSTRFQLEIAPPERLALASLRGTLVFGSGSPPPPLDPELGYPSDVDYAQLAYFVRNGLAASNYRGPLPPYEGYPYAVRERLQESALEFDEAGDPLLADGILQLEFDTASLIAPWCELQVPQPTGTDGPSCVKGNAALADDFGRCFVSFSDLTLEQEAEVLARGVSLLTEQVDCDKLFLCESTVCECTETGCRYDASRGSSAGQLVLRRDGDSLTGVFTSAAFLNDRRLPVPLGTVRLTRQRLTPDGRRRWQRGGRAEHCPKTGGSRRSLQEDLVYPDEMARARRPRGGGEPGPPERSGSETLAETFRVEREGGSRAVGAGSC